MRFRVVQGSVSLLALAMVAAPAAAQPSSPTLDQPADQLPNAQQGDDAQPDDPATTQAGGIQDILVTAQRRSENIQDVPIAISAFSADQLQAQGVTNTLQLGQYVPNLVAQTNTGIGSANAYFLRGLGNTESIATFDPPVGTYVDDIYLSRQNANNLSFFDVERIEVLRGPQGTLFGRNTTGGAINVILREPGENFGGFAEVGYGSFNRVMGRLSVDLPITSGLAIKLSGYYQDDEGYARNVTTGERVNDDDGWGARIGVRAELTDNISWVASYAHIVNEGENLVNFECNPANPTQCDGRYVTTGLRQRPDGSIFRPIGVQGRKADFALGQESATNLITSNVEIGL
ncbi:MAG TPA: TonB-dependent receptor plug domain-containing protein, partial [Lautropia sp.]|nr:TonB-dependent receptor plug domain-containing protein [Lautropia sp.]